MIVNSWNNQGKPEVKDGNGIYNVYFIDGKIAETGCVKDKLKSCMWKTFYPDGSKREIST